MYRSTAPGKGSSWATREIAALDFLLGVPLEAERSIVRSGLKEQHNNRKNNGDTADTSAISNNNNNNNKIHVEGGWWQALVLNDDKGFFSEEGLRIKQRQRLAMELDVLELPTESSNRNNFNHMHHHHHHPFDRTPPNNNTSDNNNNVGSYPTSSSYDGLLTIENANILTQQSSPITTTLTNGSTEQQQQQQQQQISPNSKLRPSASAPVLITMNNDLYTAAPGRRLDGIEATLVNIPREATQMELKTRQKFVARQAEVREWEQQMISPLYQQHLLQQQQQQQQQISPNQQQLNQQQQRFKINPSSSSLSNYTTNTDMTEGKQGLLDGRIFFSSLGSYPLGVMSVIKYEPRREEEIRRRKKLEALGGGGTQFVIPQRDWRGVSYRMLLPRRVEKTNKSFNRMLRVLKLNLMKKESMSSKSGKLKGQSNRARSRKRNHDHDDDDDDDDEYFMSSSDEGELESETMPRDDKDISPTNLSFHTTDNNDDDITSSSDDDDDAYHPGFLDDPEMKQGRHHHVMVGDKVTGCVVSSTIHFVMPADLKADLNKQFRQRFEQWEPPKSQRKFIGAKVVDGTYTLFDPTETAHSEEELLDGSYTDDGHRVRKPSIDIVVIRMPPSLTLSKIRSLKQKLLLACVRAKLEVSTMALACVYFERLCLDCHVDKSNRRLSFAACLLIAAKINEANIAIVHGPSNTDKETKKKTLTSWIRPTKKHNTIFASLLEFFTNELSLSLKAIFAAEWGVFAALGFSLHASPSQVAFHFKRLMKSLEWSPINYLGEEMYNQWQDALKDQAMRKEQRKKRIEKRRMRKEENLMKLQRELQQKSRRSSTSSMYSSSKVSEDTFYGKIADNGEPSRDMNDEDGLSYADISNLNEIPKHQPKRKLPFFNRRLSVQKHTISELNPSSTLMSANNEMDDAMKAPVLKRSISTPNMSISPTYSSKPRLTINNEDAFEMDSTIYDQVSPDSL